MTTALRAAAFFTSVLESAAMFPLAVALAFTPAPTPESRAIAFLAREVPAWTQDHKCCSCHNNGDGARALYEAVRNGHKVPDKALEVATSWLTKPDAWDDNGGDRSYSDKQVDRIQFSSALLAAMDAERIQDNEPLLKAAALLAGQQHKEGYWRVGAEGSVGSPVTYGPTLATAQARRVLQRADAKKYDKAIRNANAWLRNKEVKTVLDAGAVLLALEQADDDEAKAQRKACLALIRKGEAKDGGWGPYVNSPREVFDTALVVLALSRQSQSEEIQTWLKRGRAYLVKAQNRDGSWPETTRPSGAESYAQRISTTAWALEALLASQPKNDVKTDLP
jgi:hypothetical protein